MGIDPEFEVRVVRKETADLWVGYTPIVESFDLALSFDARSIDPNKLSELIDTGIAKLYYRRRESMIDDAFKYAAGTVVSASCVALDCFLAAEANPGNEIVIGLGAAAVASTVLFGKKFVDTLFYRTKNLRRYTQKIIALEDFEASQS